MTIRDPSFAGRAYLAASLVAVLAVLLILAVAFALLIYAQDVTVKGKPIYIWMLREGGPVERLTAILLGLAALFAMIAVFRVPDLLRWARPFLIAFAVFSIWMALEEISWGQRIFHVEPGAFFQQYSDQKETNFHNVMQLYLKEHGFVVRKTRHIAALVLLAYGVVMPILNGLAPFRSWFRACRVIVPPPALVPGFLFGAYLCWFDRPTGREEELGELLFSLCFALLVPLWRLQQWSLTEPRAQATKV
jgi:hypothetical protein